MLLDKVYNILKKMYLENMDIRAQTRILDLGCGLRGNFMGIPAQAYIGIDVQEKIISKLKGRNDGKYEFMDAKKLAFEDNYFDYIISTSLFHHLSQAQCLLLCDQVKAKLKKEGLAIFADGVYPQSRWNIAGRLIRFFDRGRYVRGKESYKKIFLNNFRIEKEYYYVSNVFAYSVLVMKKHNIII